METVSSMLVQRIDKPILVIRRQKAMLDADLAEVYGVKTKRLNEQVKRNKNRFPTDFMFQLTEEEKQEVVAYCDHLTKIKFSSTTPFAFTEHGAIMLASVLNTALAIETSVLIVRAFVKLREMIVANNELSKKIMELENKYGNQFKVVFQALRELIFNSSNLPDRKRIGYKINPDKD